MRKALPMAILLLIPLTSVPAFARDALAGKWAATVTPDDTNAREYTDTLHFKNGKLESDELKKQGFDAATVNDKTSSIGVAANYEATLKNKDGDTAVYSGTATANEMTGTLTITKKDGTKTTFAYKATRG